MEGIKGRYCSCKVGERTFGCCSHITAVVRFLSYDRHQPQVQKVRTKTPWNVIDCAEEVVEEFFHDSEDEEEESEDEL